MTDVTADLVQRVKTSVLETESRAPELRGHYIGGNHPMPETKAPMTFEEWSRDGLPSIQLGELAALAFSKQATRLALRKRQLSLKTRMQMHGMTAPHYADLQMRSAPYCQKGREVMALYVESLPINPDTRTWLDKLMLRNWYPVYPDVNSLDILLIADKMNQTNASKCRCRIGGIKLK